MVENVVNIWYLLSAMGIIGIFILPILAWIFSMKRKEVNLRPVIWGIIVQFILALFILRTPFGRVIFETIGLVFMKLLDFSMEGAKFVFGDLALKEKFGFIFIVQALIPIIFFSSLMNVLYYIGVMQLIVEIFARIMVRTMGTSGAESLSASANIFVGQTEAPLVVRPYVGEMTKSEILAIMSSGMATVAGGVMIAYITLLKDYIPDIAGHLLTASVMSAPASLVMAKIILPETEEPKTRGTVKVHYIRDANLIDSVANGATIGCQLMLNVMACLVAFMALLTMANFILTSLGTILGIQGLTLEKIFGWLFSPIAFLMGVPLKDCTTVGSFLGQKIALNEFVAYLNFSRLLSENPAIMEYKSKVILSYAICGFANFLSIGIQIGGISAVAPHRRSDLAQLGFRAMIAGALASFQTASIVGILL